MKRRRVWIWLLASLGVLVAVPAAIVWDAHRRADGMIARHREEVGRQIAAYRARDFRRPPLEGEGVEGNAWDLYALHLPAFANLPPDEEAEIPEVNGTWELDRRPDDEVLDVLYLKYRPSIQGILAGLQCRVVDLRTEYELGNGADVSLIGPAIKAAKVLGGGIAHYHRVSRGREALELAVTGLGFAQDQRPAILGLLVRSVIEGVVLASLQDAMAEHRFAAGELERFAGLLEKLDAARPTPDDAWDSEELFIRSNLVLGAWEKEYPNRPSAAGWRQLWSSKVARAQALAELPRFIADGRRLLALPPPARVIEADRLMQEWAKVAQPMLGQFSHSLLRAFRMDVEYLMRRTLLRVSVAIARYELEQGGLPATLDILVPRYLARVPACPLTGLPLGYQGGRVWSPGRDGVDNGGISDPQNPYDSENAGFDLVWTVNRRK